MTVINVYFLMLKLLCIPWITYTDCWLTVTQQVCWKLSADSWPTVGCLSAICLTDCQPTVRWQVFFREIFFTITTLLVSILIISSSRQWYFHGWQRDTRHWWSDWSWRDTITSTLLRGWFLVLQDPKITQ